MVYTIRDNQIILNPDTDEEYNLTEAREECKYCKYDKRSCKGNGKGVYCDWFTPDESKEAWDEIL